MKPLLLATALVMTLPAFAEDAGLMTEATAAVAGHIVLVGQSCGRIFNVPQSYQWDAAASSFAMTKRLERQGARDVIVPDVQMNIKLSPVNGGVSNDSDRAIHDWARQTVPSCANQATPVEPYPSAFITLSAKGNLDKVGVTASAPARAADGSLTVRLNFNPVTTDLTSLAKALDRWRPVLRVRAFQSEFEAYAKIDIDYGAFADFANTYFTERVCRTGERCWKVFGWKVRCEDFNECEDVPRMTTNLKSLSTTSKAVLKTDRAEDVPESKVDDILDQLMSRFMISAFQEQSRQMIDNVTTVTLGQLRKEARDRYVDEQKTERIVERSVDQSVLAADDFQLFQKEIESLSRDPEIVCLKKQLGRLPIPASHPCLRRKP